MTTNHNITEGRDEVLFAFDRACSRPTTEQIIDWCNRYPQFAEDIRAYAAVSRDLAAREGRPVEEPSDTMLARGFSRVLNLLYEAETAAASKVTAGPAQSFQQILASRKTDLRQLARKLDIARSVLADLVSGRMLAPVGERLAAAITSALPVTRAAFDAALQLALEKPSPVHAKAKGMPTAAARSYEAIIRDSDMPLERKRYWLGEE